jgi:hypothetical protein
MVERMIVEVPAERRFDVSDLTIAGNPIHFGGQIAECITVKLVGIANILPRPINRAPAGINNRPIIDPFYPRTVGGADPAQPLPAGFTEAFLNQGTGDSTAIPRSATPAAVGERASTTMHGKRRAHGKHRL